LTADYLTPIIYAENIAYPWFYTYNSEYLNANYGRVGMKIRVPNSNFTRICIPGTT